MKIKSLFRPSQTMILKNLEMKKPRPMNDLF